ncbi:TPA: glycosyltransferase family 4 protein [Vibrio parahaemolyticus]|nr:glycosyltransferase family 4 protein [Vibrio parahaemolyticus]
MKILYIDNSPWWGGAEECLKRYIHDQNNIGWNVKVCVPFPSNHHSQYEISPDTFLFRHEKVSRWMPEYYVKPLKGLDRINKVIRSKRLKYILKSEKPDVVFFNLLRHRDIWDIKEARKENCKIVLHIRSLFHQAKYSKELLDLADLIFCTSDIVCEQARNTGTSTKIVRIYDGLDAKIQASYNSDFVRKELNIPESSIVGLFPAILDPRKGQDLAIDAFRLLSPELPNSFLVIAGGCHSTYTEYGNKLEDMAEGYSHCIKMLGHQENMNKLYSIADYVLALSHDGEAYGLVPVEAGQYRLPVIATRAGATPELVLDKETGFLIEPGNLNELVEAIKNIQDETLRNSLSDTAYKRVRSCFDLTDGLFQLRQALEDVL